MNKHRKRKITHILIPIVCTMVGIALCSIAYLFFFAPKVYFIENPIKLEIHDTYENKQFVSDLRNLKWNDIKVHGSINTNKLGTYTLTYKAKNHTFDLKVEVKDTKKPIVEAQEQSISLETNPTAQSFIKHIEDATKTKVSFKESYVFDKVGDKKIVLVVQDEGKNKTEVETIVHILPKDTTAPVIQVHDFEIVQGGEIDVLSGICANDDRDGSVEVQADTAGFDKNTPGTYTVKYHAVDKSGNEANASATIRVLQPVAPGDKVIYLTIDDGPSANTPKILEILNRYNVKATFFVTGQSLGYASYIGEEYRQGHAIGLHTYSHRYQDVYANDGAYFADLQKISDLVKAQTGEESRIIRFPGGASNTISKNYNTGIMSRLTKEVLNRGYQYFDWNSTCGDGNSNTSTASLIEQTKQYNGSQLTFLMHDHAGSYTTVEALPAIIEYYKNRGYTFRTLSTAVPAHHHSVNN
ncbi:polysaccharide deacetylase family protein [Amedibacillus sp. YH-ame10]